MSLLRSGCSRILRGGAFRPDAGREDGLGGDDLPTEAELFGIESGTATVSRYVEEHLGLDGSFGTVEEGNRADLVLLGSNPLDDLDNLTDRVGVMVRGRWVPREEIDAGLARLAAKHRSISEE